MNQFHKVVLTVATIILIISLSMIAFFLAKSLFEDSYPPIISDCPDYWDVSYNTNDDIVCKNTSTINKGRGGVSGNTCHVDTNGKSITDFETSGSNIENTICQKYMWAKQCDITWDGISNNNKACHNNSNNNTGMYFF